MIVSVMLYPNGHVGAFDERGRQDAAASEAWYAVVVRHYMARGLAGDSTLVHVPATFQGPAGNLRSLFALPPSPPGHDWFSLYFYPDGRAVAVPADGSQVALEPWYVTALRGRNLPPEARVLVPGVLAGTVGGVLAGTS